MIERIHSLLKPVAQAEGVELVDIELAGGHGAKILRLIIDKDGGVDIEDCANISRQAGFIMDAEDVMDEPYTLEVSSPGLTRPLKKPADYQRAAGKLAVLRLRRPVNKRTKALVIVEEAGEDSVTVTLKDTGQRAEIPYEDIAKANLEIEF